MIASVLEPIFWLLAIFLFYLSLGAEIVLLIAAGRVRSSGVLLGAVGVLLLGVALLVALPMGNPTRLLVASLAALACQGALYRLGLRPKMDWQAVKAAKETARQTTLHLILLSGALIFMVPFAWLVVTSLKEDKEMSKFPPVWIPTQQVRVPVDGQEHGLAETRYQGSRVTVAVMEEYETGARKVRILEPRSLAGTYFTCNKAQLTEVRHFAPVWKNYPDALKFLPPETKFGLVFLGNTLQISLLTILGTLLSSAMVAYSFARLRWPGRDTLFLVLLATMMLPAAVTMMPVFLIFRWLGWVDTLYPLWVPAFFGSAFNIFLLRQFFLSIPTELEDAAKIDGCSYYGIFWRIMLPQIKPALAALTIMAFMASWNDFRGPLIYISSPEKQPLAYALQLFQTAHSGEPGMLMAASTLVMLPVLVLFFFTQRYFIQGITLTGIKG
ncbi:MAG TPA: carbohydrate ABC transporter permease [Chthonomonadaceae bacterium]|nr:carbohydrate ABC transporter permease [Chthonomonadaceae bacterium]